MPKSWVAVVLSGNSKFLLGGAKRVISSRFEKREHAVAWGEQCVKANSHAAPTLDIQGSSLHPQITASEILAKSNK